jgi:hypothetical protein
VAGEFFMHASTMRQKALSLGLSADGNVFCFARRSLRILCDHRQNMRKIVCIIDEWSGRVFGELRRYVFFVYIRRFKAVSIPALFWEKYSNFHIFNDPTLILTLCLKTIYVKSRFQNGALIG